MKIGRVFALRILRHWLRQHHTDHFYISSYLISSLHLLSIDFEKTFDSVERECICCGMPRRSIPEKLVAPIRATYDAQYVTRCTEGKSQMIVRFKLESARVASCYRYHFFLLWVASMKFFMLPWREVHWTMMSSLKYRGCVDDICFFATLEMQFSQQ